MHSKSQTVKTVDLNETDGGLSALRESFKIGTFVLKNAPMDFERLFRVQKQLDGFYKKDSQTKVSISGQTSGQGATRGYFPLGAESGQAEIIEKKESYSFGWPDADIPKAQAEDLALVAPNIYPTDNSLLREDVEGLLKDFASTAKHISKMIETILYQGEKAMPIDESSDYQALLRSFRYYKKQSGDPENTGANSLHTDWNLITLVYADSAGFQYRDDNGQFEDVTPDNDRCLIVNFGDFLSAWTEGQIVSPWHQVVDTEDKEERNSLVFFYYPSASCPSVKTPIYNQGEALSLFVDQSKSTHQLWDGASVATMNEMYAEKWKQVGRY